MGRIRKMIDIGKKKRGGLREIVRRAQGRSEEQVEEEQPRGGAPIRPERRDRRRMMGGSRNRSLLKARLGE